MERRNDSHIEAGNICLIFGQKPHDVTWIFLTDIDGTCMEGYKPKISKYAWTKYKKKL